MPAGLIALVVASAFANWPMPTNERLTAWAADAAASESRALIMSWGRLHAVRTALRLAAVVAHLG
jgi:Anthrone oxygenase